MRMEIELIGNHTMILGPKGIGKSNLLAHIREQPEYRNMLIWDPCKEHGSSTAKRVVPDHRGGDAAKKEFETGIQSLITQNDRERRPDLFAVEEISRYAPNSGSVPDSWLELVDLNRHYGIGIIGIARRAAQIDTTTVELADNLIVFNCRGKNDVSRLNSEAEGLGDAAANLQKYEFIVADKTRRWQRHKPVPEYDTTGKL
jgi:hypothetical protein